MARTWSVPHRGSIAAFGSPASRTNASLPRFSGSRGLGHRGVYLLAAALLTFAGAIIPQLDAQTLSTLLFLAGAGLAMLVVIVPSSSSDDVDATRKLSDVSTEFAREIPQTRLPELLNTNTAPSTIDRAAWVKLTAHMSHELRTPLNAVLGFSELMTNEVFGPLGSGYGAYARDIHASGRILLKSAEDALAITALLTAPERKRSRETSRLRSIIDEACAFAAPDLGARSIAVTIEGDGDAEIVGDHQAMRQMLINLVAEVTREAAAGAVLRIETIAKPDAVDLSVVVLSDASTAAREDGFGMILARTLCELSGAELIRTSDRDGTWSWNVRLLPARQADLFALAA
ncbi:MAG: HAMP domain-containing histidine kinase [Proteobacteria bacterium]|nr:HAMP domain-containing histidine kinase [Pseudomonadota bacterium]